ncbi:MAG: PucR family transcriptional regulator, partial [Acidimicrobiales bacterium]
LHDWDRRSRQASTLAGSVPPSAGAPVGPEGWLVAAVGARGQVWGRLVLLPGGRTDPQHRIVLEQGATTLALHRLIERDRQGLEHQTHRTLLTDIIAHRYTSAEDVHLRAESLGLSVRRRVLVAMIVKVARDEPLADVAHHARTREEVGVVAQALSDAGTPGLTGALAPGRIGVLLSLAPGAPVEEALRRVALAVRARLGQVPGPGPLPDLRRPTDAGGRRSGSPAVGAVLPGGAVRRGPGGGRGVVIGVGSPTDAVDGLAQAFAQAEEVAEAAETMETGRPYATVADVRLRGLVHLLRDDPRVQAFVERELGPILDHDQRRGTGLLAVLTAYLEAGGNKTEAAARAHLSRPALYHQLERLSAVLGQDLESAESRASLHLALLAWRSMAGPGRRPPSPG